MTKDFLKGVGVTVIALGLVIAGRTFGAATKATPIKPSANQTVAASDEQQGILAVRSAKVAVVSILGTNEGSSSSTGTGVSLKPVTTIAGTGFIVDASGLIVSNNHVVSDSSLNYTVTLADGTEYPAKVLALDKYDDVAILKINTSGLPVVKLGDSGMLETGQTVFAIGNSLGKYQDTVTRGVVSGLNRAIAVPSSDGSFGPRLQNLIQTDAAISPGNSGGPLIDMAGSVVGMNTLYDSDGSSLGFAIPINTIKSAVSQLQTYGKVQKSYLGVKFDSQSDGAHIAAVIDGSPASSAGLKVGDVITAINHEKITGSNELDTVASKYTPGTQVLITYMRGKESNDAAVVFGVLP